MSFADVDFLNPNVLGKTPEKLVHAFTAEPAQSIHLFVQNLPDEIASVVVRCDGGPSRSCASAPAPQSATWLPSGNGASFAGKSFSCLPDDGGLPDKLKQHANRRNVQPSSQRRQPMKWFQRLSERVFRFAESRENVDRLINRLGRTIMVLGIVAAIVLVIAIVLQMTRYSR
jgi:hypothetical protein